MILLKLREKKESIMWKKKQCDPSGIINEDSPMNSPQSVYRKIELEDEKSTFENIRSLDKDQRAIIDICVKYGKEFL